MIQIDSEDKRKNSPGTSDSSSDSERRPSKRPKTSSEEDPEPSNTSNLWTLDDSNVNPETLLGLGVKFLADNSDSSSDENDTEETKSMNFSQDSSHSNKEKSNNDEKKMVDFFLNRRRSLARPKGEDVFIKLSDEMVLSIFRWLPKRSLTRCSLVCKRWHQIASDEVLWTRFDLASRPIQSGSMVHILNRKPLILRLAQADIRTPIFPCERPRESRLQFLDLSMAVLTAEDLAELLSTTTFLKKLSLEHCTLNDKCCEIIGKNSNLEVLNLTLCYGINSDSITHILSGCKKLTSLNLGWTSLTTEALSTIVEMLPPTLLRLNVSGCRKNINDSHIMQLVKTCPDLVELDLSDSTILSSETIEYLSKLSKIEYFSLSRCYNIPPNLYIKLSSIPSLIHLDVFGLLSDQSIQILRGNMPVVKINKYLFSAVARPTIGIRRTSIWGLRVRD